MIFQRHIPRTPLDNYVESICYIEGNNKGTGLPKTAMSLVFNLEDSFKLFTDKHFTKYIDFKRHWVAGLQIKPTHVQNYGSSKMLVVQFKALGAFIFLNDPLHYYTNNYVALDNIFYNEADETWEQLREASSVAQQFLLIENFLHRKLLKKKFPNPKLILTVEVLSAKNATLPVNKLCGKLNISRKHLNYLSKEFAGVSTKTLFSLHRFQNTLKIISNSPTDKLTTLAYELEYHDQAHFINDFKKFAELTPNEYANLVGLTQSLKKIPHFIPFQ